MSDHNFDSDLALAIRVVRAMFDAEFIPEATFTGDAPDRAAFERLLRELENGSQPFGWHAFVISVGVGFASAMYGARADALESMTGLKIAEIRSLNSRYVFDSTPSRLCIQLGMTATPPLSDPSCFRVVNYETPYGLGWYCEVWMDEKWTEPDDYIGQLLEHPSLQALLGTLVCTDEELRRICPGIARMARNWKDDLSGPKP